MQGGPPADPAHIANRFWAGRSLDVHTFIAVQDGNVDRFLGCFNQGVQIRLADAPHVKTAERDYDWEVIGYLYWPEGVGRGPARGLPSRY